MSASAGFIATILEQANAARLELKNDPLIGRYIDDRLPIPKPYVGSGTIRLVIIGQDPTVQREASRAAINTVLNLDKPGWALHSFLDDICRRLGLSIDAQVYATNAAKSFYTNPPTTIKKEEGIDVLDAARCEAWLKVLRTELAEFPDAVVISLGQPLLSMLVRPGFPREVGYYWGYRKDKDWRNGDIASMSTISPEASTVGRQIAPFSHQPSLRGRSGQFYRARKDAYIDFVRMQGW